MTKDEILTELLKRKIIFKIGRSYHISQSEVYSGYCKNYPEEYKMFSLDKVMERVLLNVPLTKKTDTGRYTTRTKSKKAKEVLYSIINNPEIDWNRFIQTIRDYYNSDVMPQSFAKFLETGNWEIIYNDPIKGESKKPDNWIMG